jgi:predicted dehydrogenase
LPQVTVASVAESDPCRLASVQCDFPWIEGTSSALKVFMSDIDAVVIATPVLSHYELAKQALLRGKHVLVEKPLTANAAQAEELVALAREQGLTLMVGHTFEYSPAVNELREMVQAGELGRIYSIHTERLNLGLFRNDIDVIWDLAPHDISILLYVLGQRPSQIDALANAHVQRGVYDMAHMHLQFPGGTSAHVHVSWLYPTKTRRVTIVGDRRMAIYDDTNPQEMIRVYNKGADLRSDPGVAYRFGATTIPYIEWEEPLRIECADFVNAIRTNASPRATGAVGLEVVRILEDVHDVLAARTKSLIAVPA